MPFSNRTKQLYQYTKQNVEKSSNAPRIKHIKSKRSTTNTLDEEEQQMKHNIRTNHLTKIKSPKSNVQKHDEYHTFY